MSKNLLQLVAFSKFFENYQIGSCNFWGKNWRKFSKNSDTPLQVKGYEIARFLTISGMLS